jgi:hypothetical protein
MHLSRQKSRRPLNVDGSCFVSLSDCTASGCFCFCCCMLIAPPFRGLFEHEMYSD